MNGNLNEEKPQGFLWTKYQDWCKENQVKVSDYF